MRRKQIDDNTVNSTYAHTSQSFKHAGKNQILSGSLDKIEPQSNSSRN